MAKQDALDLSDDIIELTDIVEEGSLPEKKTDSTFEAELDALFGTDADDDLVPDNVRPMDPNETLKKPDMGDLDDLESLFGDLDSHASKEQRPAEQLEENDPLLDLDAASPSTADSGGIDDFEALLGEITGKTKEDEPEEIIVETDTAKSMADLDFTPDLPPDLPSGLPADLSLAEPEATAEEIVTEDFIAEGPEQNSAPVAEGALDNIFAELDANHAEPDLPEPATSGPKASQSPELAVKPAVPDGLEELDALIDDIVGDGPKMAGAKPEPAPEFGAVAAELQPEAAPTTSSAISASVPGPEAESGPEAKPEPLPVEPLTTSEAEAPVATEMPQELSPDLQNLISAEVDRLLAAKLAEIENNLDKKAAAAAAKVIREEIEALASGL